MWSPQIAAWCEAGGLYAIAGLRGGLEHGEDWHLAGNRGNKQNVFDDFAAAGDWLVAEGLTSRERLAIVGRSNGGLLVGATLTQRPDLCRAVWCGVPLLDMIRYPQFLIARLWTPEYGDPDIAEEFAWLHAYSPYHHVEDGTCYPATLFTCAEGDSRVHPLHARKMAALLQERTSCDDERPVLFSEESAAGHGVGKPVSMRAGELADALAFLSWQLGWQSSRRERPPGSSTSWSAAIPRRGSVSDSASSTTRSGSMAPASVSSTVSPAWWAGRCPGSTRTSRDSASTSRGSTRSPSTPSHRCSWTIRSEPSRSTTSS